MTDEQQPDVKRGRGRPRKVNLEPFPGDYIWERMVSTSTPLQHIDRLRQTPALAAVMADYRSRAYPANPDLLRRYPVHNLEVTMPGGVKRQKTDDELDAEAVYEFLANVDISRVMRVWWQLVKKSDSVWWNSLYAPADPTVKRGRGRPVDSFPLRSVPKWMREDGFDWMLDADGGYARWEWQHRLLQARTPLVLRHPDSSESNACRVADDDFLNAWADGGMYHRVRLQALKWDHPNTWADVKPLAHKFPVMLTLPDVPRWADGAVYHGADVPCGATVDNYDADYLTYADSPAQRMLYAYASQSAGYDAHGDWADR